MLPDPVPRDGERALARWGLPGEGAEPVFAPGARYPLAGLLLALPALEGTGLLEAARQVYGRAQGRVLRAGRYAADLGVPGPGGRADVSAVGAETPVAELVHELGPEVSDARGMVLPGGQRCREPETGQ